MKNIAITFAVSVAFMSLVACGGAEPAQTHARSNDTDESASGTEPAESESASTSSDKEEACVPKGTKANDKGIGAYCDKSTPCADDSTICTGDFGAPVGAQFCTKVCQTDAECGSGAHCYHEARGAGCVVDACK